MKLKHLWLSAILASALAHAGNTTTVYYYTPYKAWTTVNMHYQPTGGTWTTVPGVAMAAACTNWVVKTVDIGTATGLQAVFNNGQNVWDNFNNQSGSNYSLGTGIVQVKNGTFTANASNPCPAPDTIAPSVPAGLAKSNLTATSVTVTWTAATDNIAVTGYDIYRNSALVGSSSTASYNDISLAPNTTYSYTVKAKDAAGNVSAASAALSVTTPNAATATIHYKRTDGNYTNWCLHLWGTGLSAGVATTWTAPRCFEGTDAYGKFTTFTLSNATTPVNLIVHQGDTKDVTIDRAFTPSVNPQIWLKQGDATVYTVNPDAPDTAAPSVPSGVAGSMSGCSVVLNWSASSDDRGVAGYNVYRNGVKIATVTGTTYTDTTTVANTTYTYTISAFDATGNNSAQSSAISVATGNCSTPVALRLGVMYTATQSTFSIWSPDSANVKLNLQGTLYTMAKVADQNGYTSVYSVTVPGNHHLKTYNFLVNDVSVRDPYGVMVQAGTNNNIVMDLSTTALGSGWAARPAFVEREDAVIYEAHVRDFTIDASSGVAAALRGKYAGMTAAGTTVNGTAGAAKTGIDHLVDLGVTHVQLLPIYDFGSCSPTEVATNPGCYNWGYDPVNYNVPEERYSQTPNDYVSRVKELKTMVDEFHKRGIRVVMDVVYNHTFAKEMFNPITSKYYTATDLSGTGNSIDVKNPMVARMIRDSLEYWIKEYNIDGFRFDLVGVFDHQVYGDWGRYLNQQFPDRNIMLYGEPWNGFATDTSESTRVRYGTIGVQVDAHVGVFNGAYREALKGSSDNGNAGGFMFNQGTTWGATSYWPNSTLGLGPVSAGVEASTRYVKGTAALPNLWDAMFSMDPEQTINYVDAHDNLCLNDKVEAWAAVNGQASNTAYKRRLQEYALGMVLTSQGIPFLHGGSEMLRNKQGDHNSYKSSDSINKYDWNWRVNNSSTYDLVKKMIQMRRAHPGFRMNTWDEVRTNVQSDQRSASLVVTQINGAANGDSWSKALVIYNSGGNQVVTLPAGNWKVFLEKSDATAGADRVVSGTVTAEGTSVTVLYQ